MRLFSPEHGYRARGPAGARQGDSRAFGVPVVSLYGAKQAPTAHDLRGLDALVYDLQDAGVRFYTYVSTEILALRVAAKARLPVVDGAGLVVAAIGRNERLTAQRGAAGTGWRFRRAA